MSKQLGILFKPEMVRAILEGRKTQTRRGVNFMKRSPACASSDFKSYKLNEVGCWFHGFMTDGTPFMENVPLPWKVGDYLYVKETWWSYGYFEETGGFTKSGERKKKWVQGLSRIEFAADNDKGYVPAFKAGNSKNVYWRKMSSLFLRKDDARIWLKVTNVRVERLLDISDDDAIKEGVSYFKSERGVRWKCYESDPENHGFISAGLSYLSLWDSINGAGSHKENCWVWVIEFERCEKQREAD